MRLKQQRYGQAATDCQPATLHQMLCICQYVIQTKTPTYKRLAREQHVSEGAVHYTLCRQSEHVLKFVEVFEEGSQTYIVTKLARGGDLLGYLGALGVDKLSEEHARVIVAQIAHGLKEIHANGIVHRDLKHLNIFISD